MVLDDLNAIFIHVPKTAGNFLTRNFFHRYSRDVITARGHQDGWDRFEIEGPYTAHKHMKLVDYREVMDIGSYYVVASVRDPVQRLISLYFSPHRTFRKRWNNKMMFALGRSVGLRLESGPEGYKKVPPRFDMNAFQQLVDREPTTGDYLEGYREAKGLFLIRNESIESDLEDFFAFCGLDIQVPALQSVNSSRRSLTADQTLRMKTCVLASRHGSDLGYLEKLEHAAINSRTLDTGARDDDPLETVHQTPGC